MKDENKQELILKVESKIISANTAAWEAEQKAFLSGLTAKFETDEDFAKAEVELKEIEARENAAKTALEAVVNGSQDVSALIENVSAVIEDLRQARISHKKIIATEKEARKQAVIDVPLDEIRKTYSLDTPVTPALKVRLPIKELEARINDSAKKKRGIDGIKKGVNAEFTAIKSEMMPIVTELNERLDMFPADKMHLFADVDKLIASDDDLQLIIDERIKADDERQAAEKARQEAEEKARIETAEKARQVEQTHDGEGDNIAGSVVVNVVETQSIAEPQRPIRYVPDNGSTIEPSEVYTIFVNDTKMHVYGDITDVKAIAKCLKGNFETVRLIKGAAK